MTNIERLVALLSSRWSEMTSGDHIAARELAARVAEELAQSKDNYDTILDAHMGMIEENATLRTEIKHLQEVIHHYVDLQSASRLPDEEEPKS